MLVILKEKVKVHTLLTLIVILGNGIHHPVYVAGINPDSQDVSCHSYASEFYFVLIKMNTM